MACIPFENLERRIEHNGALVAQRLDAGDAASLDAAAH